MSAADIVPESVPYTLKCGRKLVLREMSFVEFRDLERFQKTEQPDEKSAYGSAYVLWLLCRKEGVSKADQIAGKWSLTLDELLVDLTLDDLKGLGEVMRPFLPSRSATKPESHDPPSSSA